jgi:hypothetical protein
MELASVFNVAVVVMNQVDFFLNGKLCSHSR